MKILYSILKEYVGPSLPPVSELERLLTFHAFEIDGVEEKNGETIIDVKVLPDRSSDCLSHRGIAREIATLLGTTLEKDPFRADGLLVPKTDALSVSIHDPYACRRFTGAVMTGVTVKQSPEWLRTRLEALGQRSINNVVDATNYVMYCLGQPLHAYDARKIEHPDNVWKLDVRMAKEGEGITTLTGDEYSLDTTVQLIVDGTTNVPLGIAGIKGGIEALVDSQTTALIVEAANFDPILTRKASHALRLGTDASKRFENDVPLMLAPYALTEVVQLIADIAGGACIGYVDVYPTERTISSLSFTLANTNALLGLSLTREIVENILARLGCVYVTNGDGWTVTPPPERTDILIEADIIAEIGRIYGYEHVTSVVPHTVPLTEYNARHYYSEKIRKELIACGFSEVITSSFRKKDIVSLQNALASDKGSLRSTLSENIREVLERNMPNVDLLGLTKLQVFEIGTVFSKNEADTDVVEHVALTIGVRKKQQGYTPKDDEELKDVIAKIEALLGISLNGKIERGVFECNLSACIEALPKPTAYEAYTKSSDALYMPYSVYPFIARDIALWVPEGVSMATVETLLREHAGALLVRLTLFDTFTKEGKTSYAFRLVFQSMERTLTDEEVLKIMEQISVSCQSAGYVVR